MTRAEILRRILFDMGELLSLLPVDPVLEEHTLVGDLGLSNEEFVELTFSVEKLFAFEVDTDETDTWATMGNVVDTVERFFGS